MYMCACMTFLNLLIPTWCLFHHSLPPISYNVLRLKDSSRVNGILLRYDSNTSHPNGKCPCAYLYLYIVHVYVWIVGGIGRNVSCTLGDFHFQHLGLCDVRLFDLIMYIYSTNEHLAWISVFLFSSCGSTHITMICAQVVMRDWWSLTMYTYVYRLLTVEYLWLTQCYIAHLAV